MRRFLVWLVLAIVACVPIIKPVPVKSDIATLTGSISISAVAASTPVYLQGGQVACSFTTSGVFTGLSVTVQITPDNVNWVTSGISAAITATGTVGGSLNVATIPNPLAFRLNATALTSGSATVIYNCGPATSASSTGAVTQGTSPWVIGVASTPLPVSGSFNGTSAGNYTNPTPTPFPASTSGQPIQLDANGNTKVNVINTPNVTVFNTPGVTIQNTPGVACVSGCGAAAPTPLPTASAGAPIPANATNGSVVSFPACVVPAGATPNAAAGTVEDCQSDANGNIKVNVQNATSFLPQVVPSNFFANCNPCTAGAAGAQVIAPINGTKTTYMLWLAVNSSITQTITLEYGTTTTNPCDTGTVSLGVWPVVPGIGISLGFHTIPSAKAYCMLFSAAGTVAAFGAGYQQ